MAPQFKIGDSRVIESREGSLPRNPNGKIDRKLLAQELQNTFMKADT